MKIFGSDPVQDIFSGIPDLGPGPEQSILDEAYDSLGRLGPGRLVNATHRRGGAWEQNYMPGRRHCVIPDVDILRKYRELDNAA